MENRVIVLREAIVKITQMLVGKSIEVTQTGVQAYVKPDATGKPVLVNLPYLPDNAPESLCVAIQGFLDHEVAHILFSDFGALKRADALGCKVMMNLLEDARIEKKMAERFSGCAYNLEKTGKFFLDNFTTPSIEAAAKEGNAAKVQGLLIVPLIRALAGQQVWKEYIAKYAPAVEHITAKIEDLAPQIQTMETTEDALNLAVEIKKRLEDDSKGEGEGEGEGEGSSKKKSKSKPKSSSKPKAKPEKKDEEDPADDEDDDEDEESEPAPSDDADEGDEDDGEDAGVSAGSDGDDDADEGDEGGSDSAGSDSEEDSAGDGKIGTSEALGELEKDKANGYDETLSRMITSAAVDASKASPYLIFSKEDDVVEQLKIGGDYQDRMFTALEKQVSHMVGPIQKDLERAISARSKSIYAPGFRSGRLHSANLSRLLTGDDRVFRRKHVATSKDVAVSLVVDMSGSMAGAKIHTASASAYALSAVLERIGISHEVICFSTGYRSGSEDVRKSEELIGRSYTRAEPLNMPIIKTFKERIGSDTKKRFGWLPNCGMLRNNVDGECIEIAARRLMARPEAGKVMIVLSDGEPHAYGDVAAMHKHLKQVVKNTEAAGVNVIGIGIMSEAVRKFYAKSLVIHDIKDLPNSVIKELKGLLIR